MWQDGYEQVLTADALDLLARVQREFGPRRLELLEARRVRDAELAAGALPDFLAETKDVRESDWQVAPPAPGLLDRRAEITGPTDWMMVVNVLNSGPVRWRSSTPSSATARTSSTAAATRCAPLPASCWTQRQRGDAAPRVVAARRRRRGDLHNGVSTKEGTAITADYVRQVKGVELEKVKAVVGDEVYDRGRYDEARELFEQVALADEFVEFVTLPAYERLA